MSWQVLEDSPLRDGVANTGRQILLRGSSQCSCLSRVPSRSFTFFGDQREVAAGDIQNDEAEDSDAVEDALDELPEVEGKENWAMDEEDGVANNFGDFS